MKRDFEDHCWKDIVDADTLQIYQAYRREIYVGDNPAKDFVTPRRLGWQTVRLRVHGQLRFTEEPPSPAYRAAVEVTHRLGASVVRQQLVAHQVGGH